MDLFYRIFSNYVLNAALFSWLAAQILKTVFNYVASKKFSAERLIGAGGMPSAHTAAVCAMTMAVSRKLGFSSPEFAISLILSAVVMYDAMGIRRAAGEQAKVLNRIVNDHIRKVVNDEIGHSEGEMRKQEINFLEESEKDQFGKDLKEILGHTPLEVLCGALLGIIMSLILPVT